MQHFFGHVSTPGFITHYKSALPEIGRGRVPTCDSGETKPTLTMAEKFPGMMQVIVEYY